MAASYRIHSRDYLQRAKELRAAGETDRVFHAAFELRCSVEARLQEYLEVREDVSNRLKSGWEIPKMAKGLERIFEYGDQIAEFAFFIGETDEVDYRLFYTPVTKRLQEIAGRLGNYLHAQRKLNEDDDPFWADFKTLLDEGCSLLADATLGTLLGIPLQESANGNVKFSIEAPEGDPRNAKNAARKPGNVFKVYVAYHDKIPDYARG